MPTYIRAKHIQSRMGGEIYWDTIYLCYRVMRSDSPSLRRHYEDYRLVDSQGHYAI